MGEHCANVTNYRFNITSLHDWKIIDRYVKHQYKQGCFPIKTKWFYNPIIFQTVYRRFKVLMSVLMAVGLNSKMFFSNGGVHDENKKTRSEDIKTTNKDIRVKLD